MEFESFSSSPDPEWMHSSSPDPERMHDVFINFRGEDTRMNFVSHLHAALSNAGVNTFLDEANFPKGVELKQGLLRTIERSRICLVVFSRNYTESSWCLEELENIIECHQTYGHIVLPIFYLVTPSQVRHQTGDFGNTLKAFARQRLWGKSVMLRWKNVLTAATNFSGWDVTDNRNQAQLVKEIVEVVIKKLDNTSMSVTEFPVGLESRMQEVIGFIANKSSTVCIIGIWGMGGLGKTTTAKVIFNQIHRRFGDKCFIEDIRELCETDRRGHVHLQEQLISDILKTKVNVKSVGMGRDMLMKNLSGRKACIVLDDVNEFDQLQDLCGNRKWFGRGSVIIITTRDVRLLNRLKVDYVYKMKEMDENESLELFSWHAFREEKPIEEFGELARNVVAYCGGLPLALEVLGSYLSQRTKKEWESVLSKLKLIPNDQVQEKLRISFDGLRDDMAKDTFLDVCCFFIGKDRGYVTEILNGCGLHADIGIAVLIERSLIKVEKSNKLGIHDLLRDMGREIIRESSTKTPGKRSRLWFHDDVVEVLTKNTGTEAIEGLTLKIQLTSTGCFNTSAFKKMQGLRLLHLDHVKLSEDYGYLPKQLRWIYWKRFPLKYIPNNFCMQRVIAIDLKYSNLRQVWKEPQVFPWLKILNLSHSKFLIETPDFSKLPSLEKLILKDCPSLCKVDQSIGDLCNLQLINLEDCTSLSSLPIETYKLKSLKTLILSGCSKIEKLEEDIGQMESLTSLIAKNTAVKQVPFSIVRSKSVGYISLCGFEGLSRNVFPSIILSWMSPTMNPLSHIHSFSGTSASIVSMDTQNNALGDPAPVLSNLSNLRSVLVQCDTEFQLSTQLGAVLDGVYDVNISGLEITSEASQTSKHSLNSYMIGIGSYEEVFNTLSKIISEGLTASESCDVLLPSDNYPSWLAKTGEGHSVSFIMPEDCRIKGMALCVVYCSNPENTMTESLVSVLLVNNTKSTIHIYKHETLISFKDEDWEGLMSHLGSGDTVEIFVTFGDGLVAKKTALYLICDESIEKEMVPSRKRKKEAENNAFVRFVRKISRGIRTFVFSFFSLPHSKKKPCI